VQRKKILMVMCENQENLTVLLIMFSFISGAVLSFTTAKRMAEVKVTRAIIH
jgi:hypothetical protein